MVDIQVMWTALGYATKWLERNVDSIEDVDYYHYLGFLRALMARYPDMSTGRAIDVASLWFARRYASLEWSAFFEVHFVVFPLVSGYYFMRGY